MTVFCAQASVSRRLAIRSRIFGLPGISMTTAPKAAQESASFAARSAPAASATQSSNRRSGSIPNSRKPVAESSPNSRAEKSCLIQSRRLSRGHAGGKARGETGCRRFMADCGKNLMQHAALKPALQAEIGGGMAERNADGGFLQPRLGEGSPKGRYFFHVHGFMKERNRNIVKRAARDIVRNLIL